MIQQSCFWEYIQKKVSQRDIYTPMFIVALFIIAKIWQQPKCPSINDWIKKILNIYIYMICISVPFSSVTQSRPTLCDPMDCSTQGFPVHHQLPELAQTHGHQVSDAIQPSHSLSSLSLTAFKLSRHEGLFKWVISSHQVAKGLTLQLQHQSFQWIFKTDFL